MHNLLKDKKLQIGLLFIACLNFCPSFGYPLMIQMREILKIDKIFLGYLGAIGTVLGIIGYIIYYKWIYVFPTKKMLYFMVLFSAITNLFYLYIPNQWIILIYNILFGAFSGITFMIFLNFFIDIIPKGNEGLFYALITSVSNFTTKGGIYFGGIIYDYWGYSITVIFSAITTLLCLLIVPYLKSQKC